MPDAIACPTATTATVHRHCHCRMVRLSGARPTPTYAQTAVCAILSRSQNIFRMTACPWVMPGAGGESGAPFHAVAARMELLCIVYSWLSVATDAEALDPRPPLHAGCRQRKMMRESHSISLSNDSLFAGQRIPSDRGTRYRQPQPLGDGPRDQTVDRTTSNIKLLKRQPASQERRQHPWRVGGRPPSRR